MDTIKIPHVSDGASVFQKLIWKENLYDMNFGKLRQNLNVLVEVTIKYVYSGHLVLFCFLLSSPS